jgi:polyisoprenoid-binding protein YceI
VRRALALLLVAAAAQAEPVGYALDLTHTFVTVEVVHGGLSTTRLRFDRKQGTLEVDRAAGTGRVEVTLEMASVKSGVEAFDRQLQGPDFFDVAAHPTARFVGDRFSFAGNRVAEVAGTLTLKGRSEAVVLKATNFDCYTSPLFKREVCGGDFTATVARSRFGLGGLPALAPDEVRLLVQVEGVRL